MNKQKQWPLVLLALSGLVVIGQYLPKQQNEAKAEDTSGPSHIMCSTQDEFVRLYTAMNENDKHTINELLLHPLSASTLHTGCHSIKGKIRVLSDNGTIARISVFDDTMFGYTSHMDLTRQ